MATIKIDDTKKTVVRVDKDTAIYVLEKVQEAVEDTVNDNVKTIYGINYYGNTQIIGREAKSIKEMFETLGDKLKDLLNEIKGE